MFRRAKWYLQDVGRELETRFAVFLVNVAERTMAK